MAVVSINLISLDSAGRAVIDGTRIKVARIAMEATRLGRTPHQMQHAHDHLNLAQIHAALAYYYSHQAEIEAQVAEEERAAADASASQNPVGRQTLERRTSPSAE